MTFVSKHYWHEEGVEMTKKEVLNQLGELLSEVYSIAKETNTIPHNIAFSYVGIEYANKEGVSVYATLIDNPQDSNE